jgi:hypothetical protein
MLAAAIASASAIPPGRPTLLIVGSPHLANNNRDIINPRIEDVTTPERQQEMEALVESLARFKPTRIAIEWKADDQAGLDRRYADYRSGRLQLTANERDQIALRLAAKLNLEKVDAIDWNGDAPGEAGAYDFTGWAARNGQAGRLEELRLRGQASTDAQVARWRCLSVTQWYREYNAPAARANDHRAYYELARIGEGRESPGAAWVGAWYARNLRIFNSLERVAGPQDRVLVLYGSGHTYLLDQFARESNAFKVEDTLSYLPASRSGC